MCDQFNQSVLLFDQVYAYVDEMILAHALKLYPCSVFVDAENNLYVGHSNNKVTVYKCIQDYK